MAWRKFTPTIIAWIVWAIFTAAILWWLARLAGQGMMW